ncbi:TPA: DUF551 domain-containing protein [Klebsiella pneumoniae]
MENKTMTKSTITREWLQHQISEIESAGITDSNTLAAFKLALAAMDSEPVAQDEREAFETFMAKRFGDLVDQRRAKNGDHGYIAWDMAVAWIVWQSSTAMLQAGKSSAHVVDRPVAWHHTAKSKEENHSNCCFSYSPSHDFGPRYEKPQSQPHYLPERLDYDRALHFLSTEPRKVTPETVIGGSSPVIPDGWTGNDKANAALMMLDRIETVDPVDDDRIDGIKRIVRDLAAAPHDTPALNSVQSVVTVPGKWIPVSERMPEVGDIVLTAMGGAVNVGEMECSAANCRFFTSVISGRELPATHWMPLPAGPKEDIKALIPLVSRNEQEGK